MYYESFSASSMCYESFSTLLYVSWKFLHSPLCIMKVSPLPCELYETVSTSLHSPHYTSLSPTLSIVPGNKKTFQHKFCANEVSQQNVNSDKHLVFLLPNGDCQQDLGIIAFQAKRCYRTYYITGSGNVCYITQTYRFQDLGIIVSYYFSAANNTISLKCIQQV